MPRTIWRWKGAIVIAAYVACDTPGERVHRIFQMGTTGQCPDDEHNTVQQLIARPRSSSDLSDGRVRMTYTSDVAVFRFEHHTDLLS